VRVAIAVPTRGMIHYKVASVLGKLEAMQFPVMYSQSSYGVEAARRRLCNHFMKFLDFDYMLFLDDDVLPPLDIVSKLLSHGRYIMSASYPIMQDGEIYDSSSMWTGESYRKNFYNSKGVKSIDACGLGACLIHRDVLKKVLAMDCFSLAYDDRGEVTKGEDYKFCEVARELGFNIYVDFDLKCEHLKTISL